MTRITLIFLIGISLLLSFSAEAGNRHGYDQRQHKKQHHGHHIKHHDRHYDSHRDRYQGCRHEGRYQYSEYRQGHWNARFNVNLGYGYATDGLVIYVPARVQGVIGR